MEETLEIQALLQCRQGPEGARRSAEASRTDPRRTMSSLMPTFQTYCHTGRAVNTAVTNQKEAFVIFDNRKIA